jgi:hypothetical protein
MEPKSTSSQGPATGSYSEPDESSPQSHTLFLWYQFFIILLFTCRSEKEWGLSCRGQFEDTISESRFNTWRNNAKILITADALSRIRTENTAG